MEIAPEIAPPMEPPIKTEISAVKIPPPVSNMFPIKTTVIFAPEITAKQSHRMTINETTKKLNNKPRLVPITSKPVTNPLKNHARNTGRNASSINNPIFSTKGITKKKLNMLNLNPIQENSYKPTKVFCIISMNKSPRDLPS